MQRPSLLGTKEPLDALCHYFNVAKTPYTTGAPLAPSFDMPVIRDAHMPTHVLAVYLPDVNTTSPPLLVPIDQRYIQGFRGASLPQPPPGTASPVPHTSADGQRQIVTLPVVPVTVPHLDSIPLLLLFGMGIETQTNYLAWRLLPPEVIEEFPNAAAMAQVMARLGPDQFERRVRFNQGMWKNVLALAPYDTEIVELIQTAWNVTAEARRIRQRYHR